LVDNYDSFTYNLVHYLEGNGCMVEVVRNDAIDIENIDRFDKIVLSPGPGVPAESNLMPKLIQKAIGKKPILGVCLGFQALIEYFNGTLYNQPEVKHGIEEFCSLQTDSKLFKGLPPSIKVGLYHSWAANQNDFPSCLKTTAESNHKVIMAFEHKTLTVCGVQFHPESILTEHGFEIIQNFLTNFR
jgi:anthranilate synthase component 2